MKKFFKKSLIVLMCVVFVFPVNSFAVDDVTTQQYNVNLTDSEMQQILELNPQSNESTTRASDLILTYNVGINREGAILYIVAKMVCDNDVVKCGFKKIVIQKRASTSSSWTECFTFNDLYMDDSTHTVAKAVSISSGYQYRAVCTFYAKKSLLSTQKIELNSNIISYW